MKLLKSINQSVLSTLTLVMICTILFSCDKGTKKTVQYEDEVVEDTEIIKVAEDSTFIDSDAKYGKIIKNVNGLKGSQMFFSNCEYGRYLVEIENIDIYRNPENGVILIGQLSGKVVWGEVPWEEVNVDKTEQFIELGWESMKTFNNFLIEDSASEAYINVESMNMGLALINDYRILVLRDMEGLEHPTNSKISVGESELDDIECFKYVQWDCRNLACSQSCVYSAADCNCPGYGFCTSLFSIHCMKINCTKKCERYWPIGGLALCNCE